MKQIDHFAPSMRPDDQRRAIAASQGITKIRDDWWGWRLDGIEYPGDMPRIAQVPDYLTDLNAMHQAEKNLTPEDWTPYHGQLADATGFSYDDTMSTKEAEAEWMHRVCHATAAQRAEAFLKVKGLWQEDDA
jgi:hypothetical protein